ncbi:hypothetical protein K445DRAFT_256829 [Daldinia sp. EC12]|nr:hypothetical protein K445DRAFT_256829 [Daldinia sp. EC12]
MVPNVGTYLLGRHALFLSTAYSYIFIMRASEQGYRPGIVCQTTSLALDFLVR